MLVERKVLCLCLFFCFFSFIPDILFIEVSSMNPEKHREWCFFGASHGLMMVILGLEKWMLVLTSNLILKIPNGSVYQIGLGCCIVTTKVSGEIHCHFDRGWVISTSISTVILCLPQRLEILTSKSFRKQDKCWLSLKISNKKYPTNPETAFFEADYDRYTHSSVDKCIGDKILGCGMHFRGTWLCQRSSSPSTMWSWASYSTSLNISVLIDKMEIVAKIKWERPWQCQLKDRALLLSFVSPFVIRASGL